MADASFLTKPIGGLPAWGWGVIIVIGAGIGYFVIGKTSTSTPNQSTGTNATPTVDSAAVPTTTNNPIGPYPVVPGGPGGTVPVLPPGMCPIFDNSGNVVAFGPCPPAPGGTPPGGPPPPTPTTVHATVRAKKCINKREDWDCTHPGGVPIHSQASDQSATIRSAPFGSTIVIDSTAVMGPYKGQSDRWFKVISGGYIVDQDVHVPS